MHDGRVFDVLVVYTDNAVVSASNSGYLGAYPFPLDSSRAQYNSAYAYLLAACRRLGLTAALSTSGDIVGPGTCSSYWIYTERRWRKVREQCYSRQIFDKFSPINQTKMLERNLLFSSPLIEPFNNPWLAALFFDKLQTYLSLEKFAIPSVAINDRSKTGVNKAVEDLRQLAAAHPNAADFTPAIVVKDRHGAGGAYIYKVDKDFDSEIYRIVSKHQEIAFIVQPMLSFDQGFTFNGVLASVDIRLIFQNGRVIQTYLRTAKAGDFRCNLCQGGTCMYVSLKDIPQKVQVMAEAIARTLQQDNSLYALDFVISNRGNVYFLEGNIGPGIYWDLNNKADERMSKQLSDGIAREFAARIERMLPDDLINESIVPTVSEQIPVTVGRVS
jgi:hypothetical protein